jgi:shikimate kinase
MMSGIKQSMAEKATQEHPYKLHKTVVLVGMMGAGKTAVGRALAARLDVPFLDSDQEIETAAARTIPEIFSRDGEGFFRAKESQIIARLLAEKRGVLSTGGGAFLAPQNRKEISAKGVSVWLNADVDLLWARVRHKDTRPLLRTPDPLAVLKKLYEERLSIYQQADLSVAAHRKFSIEDMVDRVVQVLETRPDVLERL